MAERFAIYFTPPQDDPLYQLASAWLGYDAYTRQVLTNHPQIGLNQPLETLQRYTQTPARYGFHATLKPPFRLKPKQNPEAIKTAMQRFAQRTAAFQCDGLSVQNIGHFLALAPRTKCPQLKRLAQQCVEAFEPFRAELNEREYQKRKPNSLPARQLLMLQRWGYPYVFDEYRFHMTLTERLAEDQLQPAQQALAGLFAEACTKPLEINQVCLFYQADASSRFSIIETFPLSG